MADVFVDFSAANDGDGTAFGQAASGGATGAFNTLQGKTFGTNDSVWIRRQTMGSAYTAIITMGVTGVKYIGWPKSGDDYYSTRPSSAQATWDGDSNDYAEFSFSNTSYYINVSASVSVELHRLKPTYSVNNRVLNATSSGSTVVAKNCNFVSTVSNQTNAFYTGSSGSTKLYLYNTIFTITRWSGDGTGSLINPNSSLLYMYDVTINITTYSSSATDAYMISMSNNSILRGITVNIAASTASLYSPSYLTLSNYCTVIGFTAIVTTKGTPGSTDVSIRIAGVGCHLQGISMDGGGSIQISTNGAIVEVDKFVHTCVSSSAWLIFSSSANGNFVRANNVSLTTGSSTITCNGTAFAGNHVICRRLNTGANITFGSTDVNSALTSYDHSNTAGDWRYYKSGSLLQSSNVYRTGGASYGLKFQITSSSLNQENNLFVSPFGKETIWLDLASGARTITIYGAYKNFADFKNNIFWISTEYYNGTSIIPVTTHNNSAVTSDSSTWTNDTGLTMFKCVLSFTLGTGQIVPLRMYGGKYESSAYFYIDPLPEVT